MSHRTYRSLDSPVAYLGFSWRQWLLIVSSAALALAVIDLLHPPRPIALWLGTVLLTGPAALSYFSSGASVGLGRLALDHARWLLAPRELAAASAASTVRAQGVMIAASRERAARARRRGQPRASACSGDLLALEALAADGLGVLASDALVRWLEVSPLNPLIHDEQQAEAIARGFAAIAARLPGERHSLQLQVVASPLAIEAIVSEERARCAAAAARARAQGAGELAGATWRLGLAQEQTLREQSAALASLELRYFVIVPWQPARERLALFQGRSRRAPLSLSPAQFRRAARDSARHSEGIASDLEALGLAAELLQGEQVARLIRARFSATLAEADRPPLDLVLPVSLEELSDSERARDHAVALRRALCQAPIDLRERRLLRIGEELEQTHYLGGVPEQTWLGWLFYLMSAQLPFALCTHVHATDRGRERLFHKRRYRRIHGNNRGSELKGRALDPDQQAQEAEAVELNAELALSSAGVYRLSGYLSLREPRGDQDALSEVLAQIGRELAGAVEAHLHPGVAAQRELLESSLPSGHDAARRTRKYVSLNVGDSTPLIGARCGSPQGIALGYSTVGRTLERLDLFDRAHANHMLLVTGESGFGKTMLVNSLYARALARGEHGAVIERGGHYQFLASLIPGAANVSLGAGEDAICPWDTGDPGAVAAEKIDYLIALHASLIGSGRRGEYGLSALEENLLGRAIREVYERCVTSGERPRELLLREALAARASREARDGAGHLAEVLRELAARLENFCGEGPYAYLADRPTSVPREAPLVVFDTRRIPAHYAGAAMFEIVEHIAERVARGLARHLEEPGGARRAPRYYLTLEEVWKLLEHEASARWVNELPRRSRHENLALIGVSQQLSDFDNAWGRAFIDNAARKLSFHQAPRQIEFLRAELGLSADEVQAISQLRTVKRQYASAYFDNGPRGRATITARYSDLEYWICTHDPEFDEPIRRRALREAGGEPWRALRLLADPVWHERLAVEAA